MNNLEILQLRMFVTRKHLHSEISMAESSVESFPISEFPIADLPFTDF